MMELIMQNSKPTAPSVGNLLIYAKSDKKLYKQDSNGSETLIEGVATSPTGDNKVKVSATDLTSDYLLSKLTAGSGVSISKVAGTSETIEIAATDLVPSVFGRTGDITSQAGDYNVSQVTNAASLVDANTFTAANTFNSDVKLPNTTTGTPSKLLAKESDGTVIEIDVVDLQDAYDNSTDPEIVTDATRGALTLKRGSTLDSDAVLEVQNGAGSNTTILTGNGQLQLDSATVQPQIVFDSNGGVDLDHYIQYNPSGVGGITIKSQQAASEVTTLELNRNSSGEFKLSGNSSDTTKSAQLINTYSVPSDEAYLQLISRNDKTAPKSANITVSSGSTDSARDSEISLSADKINTHSASVIGRDPVASNEFATKNYTDSSISSAIVGTAVYKGAWNASTNTPDLTSVAKAQGDFYIVSVAGNTLIDGVSEWSVGDWVLFNGTRWEKVDNSQTIPVNVGTGVEVFKSLNNTTNQADFRTLVGGTKVGFTQNTNDITVDDSNVAGLNTANTFTQSQTIKAGNGTRNLVIKNAADSNVIELWSDSDGDGYAAFKNSTGTDIVLIDTDGSSGEVLKITGDSEFNGVVNLASTTNGSPATGDIWLDSTSGYLTLNGATTEFIRNGTNLKITGTDHTYMAFHPTGGARQAYFGFAGASDQKFTLMNQNANSLAFGTNNAVRLTINSAGDVGIGTTTPSAKLDVVGDAEINGVLNLASTTNASPVGGDIWYDGGYYNFYDRLKLYDTSLHRDVNSSFMILGGGGTSSDGANLVLYGSGSLNKGALRNASNNIIEWDSDKVTSNKKLNLGSTTNITPTNGDIWFDSTSGNLTLKGDAELTDNVILSRASSTTISRDETSGFVSLAGGTSASKGAEVLLYGSSAGSVVGRLRINSSTQALYDANQFQIWKKLNLKSAANGSSVGGDIWYDQGQTTLKAHDSQGSFNIRGRYQTATTLTSIAPNIDQYEQININAQAGALTIAAPTGTPYERQKFIIRIRDNGTARTLTWNSTYTPIGVTLPTQTRGNVNKVLYVGCIYNANLSRWDVIAVAEEA